MPMQQQHEPPTTWLATIGAKPVVLVVGCGFGGLATLKILSGGFDVIIIDRNIYTTFQPLLYQVATAGLAPSDVAYSVRAIASRHGARFRRGELTAISPQARAVTLSDGSQIGYDYLIVATGVTAAFFGVAGAAEHTRGLYTRSDAIALRDELMGGLEQLATAGRRGELVITIVGGNATGVEMAGSLAELRNTALRTAYPEIDPSQVEIRLVERLPHLLTPFQPRLREYAAGQLRRRGVDIRLGSEIKEVTAGAILLDSGERLPSDLTVWAAGVQAPAAARSWGLDQGKAGRIVVEPDLRVRGQDRIFAVGDLAADEKEPLPQLAQPALQMGRHAARQIRSLAAGQPTAPFSYHDKGIMATIGRRSALVELAWGPRFRGTLAWFAWLGLHLVTLLGNRNRISALINLAWRYIAWNHGGGLIAGDEQPVPSGPGGAGPGPPGWPASSRGDAAKAPDGAGIF
ncbi:MAG: NAD(P)/FAD-dependent oxidoreductase [Streptosporangiaceae bacterium]